MKSFLPRLLLAFFAATAPGAEETPTSPRRDVLLDADWRSVAESAAEKLVGFEKPDFADASWKGVTIPHNWDAYEGFRQAKHGDLHGSAGYRRTFDLAPADRGRRIFLMFDGVGSFATVWVNGQRVGSHAGGLTTFTLDVTDAVHFDAPNVLAVRADHPAGIRDLPWVCGGCERAYGFSEGTQPFGIFRPVHLVVTDAVRVEPFGVHAWNDADSSIVHVRTELKNYGSSARTFTLVTRLRDGEKIAAELRSDVELDPGATRTVQQDTPQLENPHLWSLKDPHLYTLETELLEHEKVFDRVARSIGIRTIKWPDPNGSPDQPFLLNGEPVFINGIAEYEHLLGTSHAFTAAQINARVRQIEAAGFNAFRDAHHPHDLRYQRYWDHDGLLWWPQFGSHIWFDNAAFRQNFKTLLREWVRERRNSPSLVLWGLQNESKLPADFAAECSAIIRELDPTASTQRKITTCNGGAGVDWDVPQNWTGTYGGDPNTYADDLRRQRLVGEYGAWRSLGLHSEGGFMANGPLSEDRMTALMETKVRLAESVRDLVCGHFAWLFSTHSNPGRNFGEHGEQTSDGIRELDQIGPANNKGLLTIWGEPLDVFSMYRANYAPKETQPMVYIVSHTWPDRWTAPGKKSGLIVYSNCDEVELFNDVRARSLGVRRRDGKGTHFQWDDVEIAQGVLYAEGRVKGATVATDITLLPQLPAAPNYQKLAAAEPALTAPKPKRNYLYRVNCGGADYLDGQGNRWLADRDYAPGDAWGSQSWAARFANLPPFFGSVRQIFDPVAGTRDDGLFQTFRYGRDELRYRFEVPAGDYEVELYFIEPWYLAGGGADCTGWRLFDVAVNGGTVLRDLDVWREAGGRARGLKKVVPAHATNGGIEISFPRVPSYQAVISAIAISTADLSARAPAMPVAKAAPPRVAPAEIIRDFAGPPGWRALGHLRAGQMAYGDAEVAFQSIPPSLSDGDWVQTTRAAADGGSATFTVGDHVEVYVAVDARANPPEWLDGWVKTELTLTTTDPEGGRFVLFKRRFVPGTTVRLGAIAPTSIIVIPVRAAVLYEAEATAHPGTAIEKQRPEFSGTGYVVFPKTATPQTSFDYTIEVGVGDRYGLNFRYASSADQTVPVELAILGSDGHLICTRQIEFAPTGAAWGFVRTRTCESINAGTYTIRLSSPQLDRLELDSLEVE